VSEMSPEMGIVVNLVLTLASAFLASYLTYRFAIRQTLQERLLTERVTLYRPLVHSLPSLYGNLDPEEAKKLQEELNRQSRELLLYAPDNVYKAFTKAMESVRKGASAQPLVEFVMTLRKELVRKSELTPEDVYDIELRR